MSKEEFQKEYFLNHVMKRGNLDKQIAEIKIAEMELRKKISERLPPPIIEKIVMNETKDQSIQTNHVTVHEQSDELDSPSDEPITQEEDEIDYNQSFPDAQDPDDFDFEEELDITDYSDVDDDGYQSPAYPEGTHLSNPIRIE